MKEKENKPNGVHKLRTQQGKEKRGCVIILIDWLPQLHELNLLKKKKHHQFCVALYVQNCKALCPTNFYTGCL
jgi:hypothetical protein